ncbi:MAG: HlyC/CorC family transporter [Candidatus Omnitrophica bacterium]|nr:HlyC/CorC family transporter [Candidatus Omnitrophota bacterium]
MDTFVSLPIALIFLGVLAVISFYFSASETSIIGLSKIRLRHMIAKGLKRAQSIQRLLKKSDKFIAGILIGNNFVNIAISAIMTAICVQFFGYRWGVIVATFATTLFILVMCEITPKILATKHTERIALLTAPIMEVFVRLFHPLIVVFAQTSKMILWIFGIRTERRSPLITEEELRLMIEIGKEEGVLSDEERKMLQRIFEFGDTKVSEVMVPKEKIVAISSNASPEDLLNKFVEEGHARLPVYAGSIENIVGVIYAQDLLYILRDKGLFVTQDLVREAYYVLPNMRVNELLKKFQAAKLQIAIVADSHKKTQGVVTLEDLIEEIVGEIEEEHSKHVSKKH